MMHLEYQQLTLIFLLVSALFLFATNILRYDLVAALTLVLAIILGVVPFDKAFSGFSHYAVITVACVFMISRAVENTGLLSKLASHLMPSKKVIWQQITIICVTVAILSAFINNVGALALMLPVTLRIARIKNIPRGFMLMPLAFSSLLGGSLTLIGTPPNIIISEYRSKATTVPFSFFDFTPVGLGITIIGILFIALIGWKLIPLAKNKQEKKVYHEKFTAELKVNANSSLIGHKLAKIINEYNIKFQLLAIIRKDKVIHENLEYYTVNFADSFIIETDARTLQDMMNQYKLSIEPKQKQIYPGGHYLTEIVLLPNSPLCHKNTLDLKLEINYGFEIVAVSRGDTTITQQLKNTTLKIGDVLLIKSDRKILDQATQLDAVIIEETHILSFSLKKSVMVIGIFAFSLLCVITNLLKVDVAFFSAAVLMIVTGCISLENAYTSINLPILVLLATFIPIGAAIETTGIAKLIAEISYSYGHHLPIWLTLFSLILICMLMSNLINNAAVALIFAPIALQMAADWGASLDPFLMAVAVGSSCAFLTPIGHQSNTMVLGPGNYKFTDFWLMGLPLTILICIVACFMIMIIWPFFPN